MSSNYLRCFVITIGIAFILICSIIFFVYFLRSAAPQRQIDNCPRPKTFSTNFDFDFTKKSGEIQNLNGKIDFFPSQLFVVANILFESNVSKSVSM